MSTNNKNKKPMRKRSISTSTDNLKQPHKSPHYSYFCKNALGIPAESNLVRRKELIRHSTPAARGGPELLSGPSTGLQNCCLPLKKDIEESNVPIPITPEKNTKSIKETKEDLEFLITTKQE